MVIVVAVGVTRGQTTLDSACARSGNTARAISNRFVCIPYSDTPESFGNTSAVQWTPETPEDRHEPHNTHRTYPILIKERVYDLGWRENWRRVMAQPLFDHGMAHQG
jgi:hypothetical protein